MKKIFTIVALAAAMFCVGNTAGAQTKVSAGYTTNSFFTDNSTVNLATTQGFFAGFSGNATIWKGLGLMAGVQARYHMHGENTTIAGVPVKTKDQLLAIDGSTLLNWRIKITKRFHVTPMLGLMYTYNIMGKTTTDPDMGTKQWYDDGTGDLNFNRFNLGLAGGLDISFGRVHLYYMINVVMNRIGKVGNDKVTGGQNFIGLSYEIKP